MIGPRDRRRRSIVGQVLSGSMASFRERILGAWHWLRDLVTPSDAAWNGAAIALVAFMTK
jgi:hypothetical protein